MANVLQFNRYTLWRDGKKLRLSSEKDKRTYGTWSHYVLVTYYYQERIEQYVAKIKAYLQATSISSNYLEALQLAIADLFLADTVLDGRHRLHRLLLVYNLQRPHYSTYPMKVMDNQTMGSQSNSTPAVAPMVPYAVEEPGTSLVPLEVHPPKEALSGDRRIFILALQFHWHDYC